MTSTHQVSKSSDSEWLPQAPSDWEVVKLRSLARKGLYTFIDGDWIETPFITDEGIRLIQTGNIGVGKYIEQGFRYVSDETFGLLDCTEISPGDILICRLAAPVGRACIAPDLGGRMITSVDVCILKTDEAIDPRYLVYFLSSSFYLAWMDVISRGSTRDRVSRSQLGVTHVFKPPHSVQQTISAFLDKEISRIDALISKKERQIELLQEKRQAIITRAVTKGLDPNAKMKDSGVEWVGQIPESWQVRKLKTLCELITKGTTPSTIGKEVTEEGKIRFVKAENIAKSNKLELQPSFFIDQETNALLSRSIVRKDDLLFVIAGATIGKTAVVTVEFVPANTNQAVCIVRLRKGGCVEYVHYFLQSALVKTIIQLQSVQSAQPNISMQDIGDFFVPYPPTENQRMISSHLVSATATIDTMQSKISTSIDLLKEYRSSLITAAVSGRIDLSKLRNGAKANASLQ